MAAAGRPSIITPEMVKPGAAVVSAGVTYEGRRVIPDVDEACADVAGWITPRLGGVGPMTRAMLLRNTVEAAERRGGRGQRTTNGWRRTMSADAEPAPTMNCVVCGTAVASDTVRCPACGCARPAATSSNVLTRGGLWMLAGCLVAVYVVVLVVVAAAR